MAPDVAFLLFGGRDCASKEKDADLSLLPAPAPEIFPARVRPPEAGPVARRARGAPERGLEQLNRWIDRLSVWSVKALYTDRI